MNYCETQKLLDIIYKYLPAESLFVQTENTDWRGRKYKSDFVNVLESDNIGFEVFENEIIIFYFTDHVHFEDYTLDGEPEKNYTERAESFLKKLFTLPIERCYTKKGDKVVRDESFFVVSETEKESCTGVCLSPSLKNIFRKAIHVQETKKFNMQKGCFITI